MNTPLRFFFTCFSLFLLVGLQAQPRKHDLHFGCHMTDSPVLLPKLTDDQKILLCGSNARSDSIDVLNYDIILDLRSFGNKIIAECEVTITAKEDGIQVLPLDLLELNVDSVKWLDTHLSFNYDGLLLNIEMPTPVNIGDTIGVLVYYQGLPTPDNAWGGFRFANGIGYNLGIGLTSNPFNMGRSWHPCFDNFVERATYDISLITDNGRTGYAVGDFLGEEDLGNGAIKRSYRMGLPNPTYLIGVAASNYIEINDMHSGVYGDYPVLLVGRPGDATDMVESFEYLGNAIDALEAWYGPYAWGQVGYVMTPQGAMEHSTLIAFPYGSIGNGPTFGMNRLMAHELAHHWWGNVTTLSCPENMWIKEGNAEYGSHLFQEYTFGKEFFKDVVISNHFDVIQNAHTDDGNIYHPISGIPYEYTYGTHTYNKGADMMHNLRGYLGDTLFSKGMTSVLTTHQFSAVDAQEMQDQLTVETGVDMSHFFNNWIYQAGFASYEIDSINYQQNGNAWDATLHIQQKLHHAISMHTNTPLEVTFFDENWNTHHEQFMVSEEFSEATVSVPFEPVYQILNDRNILNLARFQDRAVITSTGDLTLQRVGLSNTAVEELPEGDSALISMIHHWVAADPYPSQPDLQVSSSHYWTYGGDIPAGFSMKTRFIYDGGDEFDLDFDLLENTDTNLILVWRPDSNSPWGEYPFYFRQALGGSKGLMKVSQLFPGQYAYANGEAPLATSVADLSNNVVVKIYPNPTAEQLNVQAILPKTSSVQLTVFDALGKMATNAEATAPGGELSTTLNVKQLPAGIYWLEIRSMDDTIRTTQKFVKK